MKNFPIPSIRGRSLPARGFASGFASCAGLLAAASLLISNAPAQNQTAPAVNAATRGATSSPVPVAAAPDVNVLILALDDLSAPPAPSLFAPAPADAPPAPAPPIAPADGTAGVGILTPTRASNLAPQWRVVAQKKTKDEKRREQEEADAKIFNTDPVPMTTYRKPGAAPDAAPGVAGAAGTPPLVAGSQAPLGPATTLAPPGRSQLMALALRRALVAKGYRDVQVSTLETSTIARALGEQRLSQRVLDELKRSLAQLEKSPDASALVAAGRAASRVGQATGYRAVVAFHAGAPAPVSVVGAGAAPGETTQKVEVNMVVADSQRESVEPVQFEGLGAGEEIWRETGGATGAKLLDQTLRDWPATSNEARLKLAAIHFNTAQSAFERGDLARAQDEINQSLSLDNGRAQTYILRGGILESSDPAAAATSYRRAGELNSQDGSDWAKIAAAYAYAKIPDWRSAWDAGKRALALNYDSAGLRVAMATAQYGRADLFRKADFSNKAEEAEADARVHLDRALQLAPDDPLAVRLLAGSLMQARRTTEAARTLDRIAPSYPNDLEIQKQYALALAGQPGREEDAFAAYGRVWKLTGQKALTVDAATYRSLASGFDLRLYNLGKVAAQITGGVAGGAVLQDSAVLQMTKLKEEMDAAQDAIKIMQPTGAIGQATVTSRVYAADLMNQSLQLFQNYLETGQDAYRVNGLDLYRQAVAALNTARNSQ